jgi:hypothetical protein
MLCARRLLNTGCMAAALVAAAVAPVPVLAQPAIGTKYTWRGPKDGLWSVATNWTPQGVPGPADTATFDKADVNSVQMDLQPSPHEKWTHVGVIEIAPGYTGTIRLNHRLRVDSLWMREPAAKIVGKGAQHLDINQDPQTAPVTFFQSSWLGAGTIQDVSVSVGGDKQHPATVLLSSEGSTFNFDCDSLVVKNEFSTIDWRAGDVRVRGTFCIYNRGWFQASRTGAIDLLPGQTARWQFSNRHRFASGNAELRNGEFINYPGGRILETIYGPVPGIERRLGDPDRRDR